MPRNPTRCQTCRDRRVKCDSTQPICGRCQKAGLVCGYTQSVKFIDERVRIEAAQERAKTQALQWKNAYFRGTTIRGAHLVGNKEGNLNLCPEIDFSAFQDDVYVAFLVQKLLPKSGHQKVIGHWMDVVDSHSTSESTLSLSLKCVATSFFGRLHQQPKIMARGAQQYGCALRSLSQLLQTPQSRASLATLASINALELYELVVYSTTFGWVGHAGGIGALIESRGPWCHRQGIGRRVFLENRINIILHSILNRRRTFLEKLVWKEASWNFIKARKTELDQLIDIFCDYPGLLEDSEMAQAPETPPENARVIWTNVQQQCQKNLEALSQWWHVWSNTFKGCFREVVAEPSNFPCDSYIRLFSTILYFTNVWRAHEFCVHNALRILLLRLDGRACKMVHVLAADTLGPTTDSSERDISIEDLARGICRSVPYFLKEHGSMGALLVMFPAQVALLPLSRTDQERILLTSLLKNISISEGLEIGRQLLLGRCSDLSKIC